MTYVDHQFKQALRIPPLPLFLLACIAGMIAGFAGTRWLSRHSQHPAPLAVVPASAEYSFVQMVQEFEQEVEATTHAVKKHGEDALEIRRCLNEGRGTLDVWKFTGWRKANHYIQTCRLPDGRHALRIIQLLKDGRWLEKTAFVVKSGTSAELREYVTARAELFTGSLAKLAELAKASMR